MKTNSTHGKLEAIAKRHGIETLAERKSDSLDFHDVAVWTLEAMLAEAYRLGRAEASR